MKEFKLGFKCSVVVTTWELCLICGAFMEHFSFSSIMSFILEPALSTSQFRISSSNGLYCSDHFFPVIEGFGQIALIYLPSVSCLPLFLFLPADIDECQVHNGGCQHRCVNTRGSYYCECHPGSRLHVDGRTCLGEEVILRRLLICDVPFCQELLVCICTDTSFQKHKQSWPKRERQLRTSTLMFTVSL